MRTTIVCCGLSILLVAAAPATTQPQQDEMMIQSADRKIGTSLSEFQRDSSVVYLRLLAELDRAQRHAEAQQEQARLDLATKAALATSRLAQGSEDKATELRQAFNTEVTQAGQAFHQRLAEIDAEQNQSIAQAVQRFAQQKAELLNAGPKDVQATIQRLTQQMASPDMPPTIARFETSLPTFAQPLDAAQEEVEAAYRADVDAARQAYLQAVEEARTRALTTIQRSLEASPVEGADDEQTQEIRNTVKRLGLWAADAMDTYQIALKSALRKYQLAEDPPESEAKTQ